MVLESRDNRVRCCSFPMVRGMDVEARESLPATVPDETVLKTIEVRSQLYPAQDGIFEKKRSLANGALALYDSSGNGQRLRPGLPSLAESAAVEADAKAKAEVAKARVAEAVAVEAEAKARVAEAEVDAKVRAAEAEAAEKFRAAKAEADARIRVADAKARVAEAEATTKIRVQAAEAREADLKILKLGKEIDVFTGECEVKEYLCVSVSPSVSLSVAHCLFF